MLVNLLETVLPRPSASQHAFWCLLVEAEDAPVRVVGADQAPGSSFSDFVLGCSDTFVLRVHSWGPECIVLSAAAEADALISTRT